MIVAAILFCVIAAIAGYASSSTAVSHSPVISAAVGAAVGLALSYFCYQTRRICLAIAVATGFCGGISPWLISLFHSWLLATLVGIVVCVVAMFISVCITILVVPYKPTGSWRKSH